MPSDEIRIDQLRLRVPGLTQQEAHNLGEEVARRVADALPAYGRVEHLASLDLRIFMPSGTPKDQLAEGIAKEILKRLR
jgi:hypothetical protein